MKNLLFTGATGFIGQALAQRMKRKDLALRASVRSQSDVVPDSILQVAVPDLLPNTDWSQALVNVDVVIHLAARVHIMKADAIDELSAFRTTNTAGTINLANQAVQAGVRRFIFLSSIKVNGEQTEAGEPFTADDLCNPTDNYARSKYEAEQGLRDLSIRTGMEVVIIRPPLVYGPGVKSNFLSMMIWLHKGIPLPLGLIQNQRSLVSLESLVDLIVLCIDHPAAANEIFLVSDGEDLSTSVLLQRLGGALGAPARLICFPQSLLTLSLSLIGKGAISQRLFSSLQVDISKTRSSLNWAPSLSVDKALQETAQAYLATKKRDTK